MMMCPAKPRKIKVKQSYLIKSIQITEFENEFTEAEITNRDAERQKKQKQKSKTNLVFPQIHKLADWHYIYTCQNFLQPSKILVSLTYITTKILMV